MIKNVYYFRQKESVSLESKVSEQNSTIRDLQQKLKSQELVISEIL